MSRSMLLSATLLLSVSCRAQEIELSDFWMIAGGSTDSAQSQKVELNPQAPSPSLHAVQRVPGPFRAGDLFRFSADVRIVGVKDDKGKNKPPAYDLNLAPKTVCLAVAQRDPHGRELCNLGSARLLGTTETRLALEFTIQQNVESLELRLLATQVTGRIRFSNMRFEQTAPAPLQPVPEARLVRNKAGGMGWMIDGQPEPLAIYFGNNQFNHDERILEEMKKGAPAGVPVFSFNLHLPSLASNSEQMKVIERFMEKFPDTYFMPRVWLGPGGTYLHSFPEEEMRYADGGKSGYAASYSKHWREFTDYNLRELIKLIRRSPYADRFVGLKLTYYQTGEWIYWNSHSTSSGYTGLTRRAFVRWLKEQYATVEKLNAAWDSSLESFDAVALPSEAERDAGGIGFFRDPATQQREIDFSLFFNNDNADTIIEFGKTVKEATGGKSLVATFYGYLFELAYNGSTLQRAGQLGLGKLCRSPYVDIVGAPYSYNSVGRGFGLPVDFHGPFDGLELYGKTGLLEEDTFTHLALSPDADARWSDTYAPGYGSRTTNMKETLAVLRRNLGVSMARNYVHLWQNLFSEGRFNDQRLWDMYKPYLAWMKQRAQTVTAFEPQVAVLVSAENLTLLRGDAEALIEPWLFQTRYFLNRVDTSVGYYLQSDLEKIPESVRCVVLLNPYRISDDEKAALKEKFMRDGRMVVFCHMPAVFGDAGFSAAGSAFCGIDLKLKSGTLSPGATATGALVPSLPDHPFGKGVPRQLHQPDPLSPYMTVQDSDAVVFAKYNQTGEAACALKPMDGWTSVFLGAPRLPVPLWRELFKRAGCHLYLDNPSIDFMQPDIIQANGDFLMVQSARGGIKTIRLPAKAKQVYRFDGARPKPFKTDCQTFTVRLEPGVPAFFVLK